MKPIEKVKIAQYILLAAVVILAIFHMEWIANLLQNTTKAIVFGLVSTFLLYDTFVGERRIWTLFEFMTSKLLSIAIIIDPVRIARIDLQTLFNRKEKIKDEGIKDLITVDSKINANLNQQASDYKKLEREIQTKPDGPGRIITKKKMDLITSFLEKYNTKLETVAILKKNLYNIYEALGFLYDYKTIELDYYELDYNLSKSISGALKTAMKIIKGEQSNSGLYNQSLSYMQDFIMNSNAEIDLMLADCNDFMKTLELGGELDETKVKALEAKTASFYTNVTTEIEKSKPEVKA